MRLQECSIYFDAESTAMSERLPIRSVSILAMRGSFDESSMETLTTLGPTAVPAAASPRKTKDSKVRQTVAWSEHGSESRTADQDDSGINTGSGSSGRKRMRKPNRKPIHKLAVMVVLCQAVWAWIIPIKNIATVTFPTTRPDSVKTLTLPYMFSNPDLGIAFSTESPQVVLGAEIVPLLYEVLEIVLGDDFVRGQLLERGSFDVEGIYKLLSIDGYAVLAKYYSLVVQATEFPGGRLTTRKFGGDNDPGKLTVVFRDSTTSPPAVRDMAYELACSAENAFLKATRCNRDVDGYPCDTDTSVGSSFTDVKLSALASNTGLDNNVALLYVIDYFHQVMSTLFATKDWTTALEDLNYNQSTERALDAGTASIYKDGYPYLLDSDAYLVGIQAARMDTMSLESCVAAEIVVGQFYVRTFVLRIVQESLSLLGLLGGDISEKIIVPATLEAVLEPIWSYNISITSGARTLETRDRITHFYSSRVAAVRTAAGQFKFDRRDSSADQVPGSSMRLLQYMVYYEDVVSKFSTAVDASGKWDSQTYKLIGWVGSDITTFRDSYAASSLMAWNLAELSAASYPNDSWWDKEKEYAQYFKQLEESSTAPFKVFDAHLSISSATRATPADDEPATRCQRALFKVVGKVAYLALLEISTPASYLMFMAETPTGAKNWLINQVFTDELVAESFSASRLGFSYRNGPYTRKDDGSAWVVVPLLDAMIKYFGKDVTASALLNEVDASFRIFLKESNGNLNFPDAALCRVSGASGSVNASVVASDSLDQIYEKILPGLQLSILDLVDLIPSLATKFEIAMAEKNIPWVGLTNEQIVGSPVITNSTEGHGPPTGDWKPNPFTAGMRKFWPPKTPTEEAVQKLRDSTVCYKMLDLRFFNTTARCFAEPSNAAVVRSSYQSEGMRKFFQLMWSMAVMLNTMAFFVVLKYIRKLYKAWLITKFECLHFEVALQLNLQGMGVLNISQSLLLLIASLPALVTFHIPDDPVFMPFFQTEKMAKGAVDFFVTLSMSWFVKLGFDICNIWILPKRPVDWYHLFRVRWLMLMLVFILRLITPEKINDNSYLTLKLILTCVVSLLLGACCTAVIFLPERPGKVVDADNKDSHDAVVAALVKQNMPLTRYGVLGRTSKGWSKTGLIVEGWRLSRTPDGAEVLRKDGGEILLPKSEEEEEGEFMNAAHEGGILQQTTAVETVEPASPTTEVTL